MQRRQAKRSQTVTPLRAIYYVLFMFVFILTAGFIFYMSEYVRLYQNAQLVLFHIYDIPAFPFLFTFYATFGILALYETLVAFRLARYGRLR